MTAGDADSDPTLAATLLAIDPIGLRGACLRGRAGPERDSWLTFFRAALPDVEALRRVPITIADEQLLGGADWLAALQDGEVRYRRGVLAEADGGFIVLASSERISSRLRNRLTAVLDTSEIALERDGIAKIIPSRIGVIALDESLDDEEPTPEALIDRLAFVIDISAIDRDSANATDAAVVERARSHLSRVSVGDVVINALCEVAARLGIQSLRAPMFAARTARALAALAQRDAVDSADVQIAARLVFAPRAVQLPSTENEAHDEPAPDEQESSSDTLKNNDQTPHNLDDLVLAATLAALPPHLLERIAHGRVRKSRSESQGRAGALLPGASRGRPSGTRAGKPVGGARLNVIETLRAAAPWQRLRRGQPQRGRALVRIRATDLRITRYEQRKRTTTIFIVDASGSAALSRLAEAKGAVELLLADCYVRRDEVCVVAFRGRGAELVLPPTRSLVRAKRGLAGLPGGGATPLASGLQLGYAIAERCERSGHSVSLVVLTDGAANVALDGTVGRAQAESDVQTMARRARAFKTILIDIANRSQVSVASLASVMAATYLWLPRLNAKTISAAVTSAASN